VVDEHGTVVGIVSEADLIHPVESLQSRRATSVDVMTKPVVVATPDAQLDEIVTLFDQYRIKRVPIVEGGRLVGIVARSNILLALALSHNAVEAYDTA
jgi:CBS domain-containing protein